MILKIKITEIPSSKELSTQKFEKKVNCHFRPRKYTGFNPGPTDWEYYQWLNGKDPIEFRRFIKRTNYKLEARYQDYPVNGKTYRDKDPQKGISDIYNVKKFC